MSAYIITDEQLDRILTYAAYQDWDVVDDTCHQLKELILCEDCRRYLNSDHDHMVPNQCWITHYQCDKDHFCSWAVKKLVE